MQDPEYARNNPELAVMSTMMHANTDAQGEALVRTIPAALHALDAESGRAYLLMLKQVLRPALRALLEKLMLEKTPYGTFGVPEWLHKAEKAAREQGREQGLAHSILTVLSARKLAVTDDEREGARVHRHEEARTLAPKAATASSAAEVFTAARTARKTTRRAR